MILPAWWLAHSGWHPVPALHQLMKLSTLSTIGRVFPLAGVDTSFNFLTWTDINRETIKKPILSMKYVANERFHRKFDRKHWCYRKCPVQLKQHNYVFLSPWAKAHANEYLAALAQLILFFFCLKPGSRSLQKEVNSDTLIAQLLPFFRKRASSLLQSAECRPDVLCKRLFYIIIHFIWCGRMRKQ